MENDSITRMISTLIGWFVVACIWLSAIFGGLWLVIFMAQQVIGIIRSVIGG